MSKILIFGANGQLARNTLRKGEPFRGHDAPLDGLSRLIVELAVTPGLHVRASLGVSKG